MAIKYGLNIEKYGPNGKIWMNMEIWTKKYKLLS
jgi:hypothetical protein